MAGLRPAGEGLRPAGAGSAAVAGSFREREKDSKGYCKAT